MPATATSYSFPGNENRNRIWKIKKFGWHSCPSYFASCLSKHRERLICKVLQNCFAFSSFGKVFVLSLNLSFTTTPTVKQKAAKNTASFRDPKRQYLAAETAFMWASPDGKKHSTASRLRKFVSCFSVFALKKLFFWPNQGYFWRLGENLQQ